MAAAAGGFLTGTEVLLLEQGLGKARVGILSKQLEKHGGVVVKTLSPSTTHILVGNKTRLVRVPVLLKIPSIPDTVSVLRADWLSACLTKRELVSEETYRVHPELSSQQLSSPLTSPLKKSPNSTPIKQCHTSNSPVRGVSSPEKATASEVPAGTGEGTSADGEKPMLSPKAGMFGVTGRRWTRGKKRADTSAAATSGWNSSDSDYVESDDGSEIESINADEKEEKQVKQE